MGNNPTTVPTPKSTVVATKSTAVATKSTAVAPKGKAKPKGLTPVQLAAQFAASNAKLSGRAAGNIAAQAAAVPGVLLIAVKVGFAHAATVGTTYYKPAPVKGNLGGYRAAAAALGAAMHTYSKGKGYQPAQFAKAFLALAPKCYAGGQWHTWLVTKKHWQVVSK